MLNKAIILDRDGTIIVDKVYLNDVAQIEYLPKVFEGLRVMRDLGFRFFVATNQSGIARGIVAIDTLYEIHRVIRHDLAGQGIDIEGFYYAPYSVESNHPMRKPNPGMLEAAARDFNLDLRQSYMIGDRDTDVHAGRAAGTGTIYLDHSFPTPTSAPDFVCGDLLAAAKWLKSQIEIPSRI